MLRFASMAATAVLLLGADVSNVMHLQPPSGQRVEFPPGENLPVLPDMSQGTVQTHATQDDVSDAPSAKAPAKAPAKAKGGTLQPESRLELVRDVDGEFARVVLPIPAGKNGIHLKAGAPVNENELHQAVGYSGAAVNPGDTARITNLQFKDREIIIDLNGGGRGKRHVRDNIHFGIGTADQFPDTVPVETPAMGATIFLEFDKPLPDMTPDDLKKYLSGLLDFSKRRSAALQWVESLPPEMQNAIKDKRPAVGMDHDMVLAAIGRPDRKVRERAPEGGETEDWIYGQPPAKTIFVKFEGDKVIQVEQFPR